MSKKNCPKQPNTGCHPRFPLPLVAKAHLLINTPAITARKGAATIIKPAHNTFQNTQNRNISHNRSKHHHINLTNNNNSPKPNLTKNNNNNQNRDLTASTHKHNRTKHPGPNRYKTVQTQKKVLIFSSF